MTWKIDGKIAGHFPGTGTANRDAYRIVFAPPGEASPSNFEEIEKVYYIPAGVQITQANLQNYLVWRRYWEEYKKLLAGSQTVVFEYTPSSNVTLTSIGIFTDSSDNTQTVNVAIYHESGLVVYKHNADTRDGTTTKYELEGKRRHIDGISGVVLKGGLKYYIQYTQETDSNHTTFYPAYFENSSGNYKVWYHGSVQNKQTVGDLSGLNDYKGEINDTSRIFSMQEGDFFIWTGGTGAGLQNGYCYVRSSVGQNYNFVGVIGDPSNPGQSYTSSDLERIVNFPVNSEFIWYRNDLQGHKTIKCRFIYAKTTSTSGMYEKAFDDDESWNVGRQKVSEIIYDLKSHDSILITSGKMLYSSVAGYIFSKNSSYTIDSNFDPNNPLSTNPSSPVSDCLYCVFANNVSETHVYHNGGWYTVTQSNGADQISYDTVLNVTDITDLLTEVGQNSDLIPTAYDSYRIASSLRDNTTYPIVSGRKYYLEINGNEV